MPGEKNIIIKKYKKAMRGGATARRQKFQKKKKLIFMFYCNKFIFMPQFAVLLVGYLSNFHAAQIAVDNIRTQPTTLSIASMKMWLTGNTVNAVKRKGRNLQ